MKARRLILLGIWLFANSAGVAAAVAGDRTPLGPGIPYKTETEGMGFEMLRALGVTLVLLAGGVGAVWLLKSRLPRPALPPGSRTPRLNVVERIRLSPKATLYLVEVDHRPVMVCLCGDRVTFLDSSDKSVPLDP